MKKIAILSAALVILASCSKSVAPQSMDEIAVGIPFEAGQMVTLWVSSGEESEESANSRLSGIVTNTGLSFIWEATDSIKVTVSGESALFPLVSGAGTTTAKFSGMMPASGSTFDVKYPASDVSLNLRSQTYIKGGLQNIKFTATATDCTLDSKIRLQTQDVLALQLNFWGENVTVDSIVVTNTSASPNLLYTLNCGASGVEVSEDENCPTPFLIVVPASGSTNFTVDAFQSLPEISPIPKYPVVYTDHTDSLPGIPIPVGAKTSFSTTGKVLNAGCVLDMEKQEIEEPTALIWAPVNCGYHSTDYPYGKLYQWGRKYGQGYGNAPSLTDYDQSYKDATYPSGSTISTYWTGTNGMEDPATFYKEANDESFTFMYDWIHNGSNDYWDKSGNSIYSTKVTPIKGDFDPCPPGWRVPTSYEMNSLYGGKASSVLEAGTHGSTPDLPGYFFNGTSDANKDSNPVVFLPAAGYRGGTRGISYNHDSNGHYWTSTIGENDVRSNWPNDGAASLYFSSTWVCMVGGDRASGKSVRCVQQEILDGEGSLGTFTIPSGTTGW